MLLITILVHNYVGRGVLDADSDVELVQVVELAHLDEAAVFSDRTIPLIVKVDDLFSEVREQGDEVEKTKVVNLEDQLRGERFDVIAELTGSTYQYPSLRAVVRLVLPTETTESPTTSS